MSEYTNFSQKSRTGIEKILPESQRVTVLVELIKYCWHTKALTPLKIYLVLKLYTTGRISLDNVRIKSLMGLCQIKSKRTLLKHINWLMENHWISLDHEQNIVYIKSFDHIHGILHLESTKAVLISTGVIPDFRIWCASVLIAKKINEIHWRLRCQDRHKGRRSAKGNLTSLNFYAGLSDGKLAELLDISEKEAWKIKREANACGFISVKKRFKFISDTPMTLLYGMHGRFKVYKGKVWEKSPDEILHGMNFRRKKMCKKVG